VKRQTWMGLAGQCYQFFHRLQALNGVAKFGKLARPAPGSGTDVHDRTGNSICPRFDYRSVWVVSTNLRTQHVGYIGGLGTIGGFYLRFRRPGHTAPWQLRLGLDPVWTTWPRQQYCASGAWR